MCSGRNKHNLCYRRNTEATRMFGIFKGNIICPHYTVKHSRNSHTSHGSRTHLLPPCLQLSPWAWRRPQHQAHSPGRSGDRNLSPWLTALALTPDNEQLTLICFHWRSQNLPWPYPLFSTLSPTMLITHPEPVFLHSVSSQQLKTPWHGANRTWNVPQPTGSQSLISVSLPHATNQLEKSLNLSL